jgi:hypothetical protein
MNVFDIDTDFDIIEFHIMFIYLLCKCETLSLRPTLRKKNKLQLFENKVLRKEIGSNDEVNGQFRVSHNAELCDLYMSHFIHRIVKTQRLRRGR